MDIPFADVPGEIVESIGDIVELQLKKKPKEARIKTMELNAMLKLMQDGRLSPEQMQRELRLQRRHERAMARDANNSAVKQAFFMNPVWAIGVMLGGLAGLLFIVYHEKEQGKTWAVNLWSEIPFIKDPASILASVPTFQFASAVQSLGGAAGGQMTALPNAISGLLNQVGTGGFTMPITQIPGISSMLKK